METTGSRFAKRGLRFGSGKTRGAGQPAMKNVRFVGLDVHAETIAVAVAESAGEVRSLGVIPNRAESVSRLIRKLGKPEQLRVCYEAGPTGYPLYWQLTQMCVKCEVVAPTLVPVKPSDRVKTDRRDAERLARCYRAGDLTAVWVPDAAHEALRDLVRAREGAKADQLLARHRLSKFLLRHGRRACEGVQAWTGKYWHWVKSRVHFEQPAQTATFIDYVHEVEHVAARIQRLEQAIDAAVPPKMRAVIEALQALRGVARCRP
jgi:transposase